MKQLIISILFLSIYVNVVCSNNKADTIDRKIQFFFEDMSVRKMKEKNIGDEKEQIKTDLIDEFDESNITDIEELYEIRIDKLNNTTPVQLDYNKQVKRFIEIYSGRRKKEFEKMRGLAELYFPIFEEKFDKYNLPLELKYLSVVESSLNPLAVSPSGAVGLWQFLYNTSKMFDLEINSFIDERRDPYISTEAACRYFAYLYNIFNDWQLAIASFNGGPGEIRNAIERSGGKTNFWEIQPYLSEQTKNYVPAFIASVYVFSYANEHEIDFIPSKYNYYNVDTVKIKKQISFDQISIELEISNEELRFLNPVYRTDIIPEIENYTTLVLPSDKIVRFLRRENKIYTTNIEKKDYWTQLEQTGDTLNKIKIIHEVEKGEFFHKIALNYQCSIEDIKKWNNTESNDLYPGQKLFIWIPDKESHLYKKEDNIQEKDGYLLYTVQEGDTIWSIAEKFNLKSIRELKEINQDLDENNIKPGQKIKINW